MRWTLLLVVVSMVAQASETMRIAVHQDVSKVVLEGRAMRWGEDVDDTELRTQLDHGSVTVAMHDGRLELDAVPVVTSAVRFRADADGTLGVNGTKVRGDVVMLVGRTGVTVVNVIPLEEYLVGVLGSEMPKSFPLEALKAQAIAARTYALNKKLEQYGRPFHLGSSVISQVYRGLDVEDPRTREAVEATRGLVLTWQLQPIEAYFHSSCGGRTETGADALSRDLPYLASVECPCGKLPSSHWSLELSGKELSTLAGGAKGATLQVETRTATGRARKVTVGGRGLDAVKLRERVGYMRLKSLDFSISRARHDGVLLEGQGFGHGAGLCQWGARTYAERGWLFEQILSHYYPGTELQTLY